MSSYDYIIADECHYFFTDSEFNDQTDVAYNAIINQKNAVIIFMSATAKTFFDWGKKEGVLKEENIYRVPEDYSYFSNLFLYKNDMLTTLIDQILATETDTKIIVFTSVNRIKRMYSIYGDNACYYSSIYTRDKIMKKIRDENCIVYKDDGTITFDKRILFTTIALDVGISLRDKRIKHIFCEIVNPETLKQAIGRKRIIDNDDKVDVYIKIMQKNWIEMNLSKRKNQIEQAESFLKDKVAFIQSSRLDNRENIRNNPLFYSKKNAEGTNAELAVNRLKLQHYKNDCALRDEMLRTNYMKVIIPLFGEDIKDRVMVLNAATRTVKDEVLDYLKTLEGKKIFDRSELFEHLCLLGDTIKNKKKRTKTVNGLLADEFPKYNYEFSNKDDNGKRLRIKNVTLQSGRIVKQRGKDLDYWVLKPKSDII